MLVLGHKGYSARYPENTLLAFKKAIEAGADGVELDVWLTSDARVVVNHDPTLEKNYGAEIKIKKSTLGDLRNYDYEGQKIPTLDEVYESLPEDAIVNVEIKDVDAAVPALEIVKKHNALDRTIFSSFIEEALQKIRDESDDARVALLVGRPYKIHEFVKLMRRLKLNYVNPPIMGEKIMGKFTFKFYLRVLGWMGVRIVMWTVNDVEQFRPYRKLCYGVITDEVEKMLEFLGRK